VVDRLLASPRYAERMTNSMAGSRALSPIRTVSSDGQRTMWRWRDWVLEALTGHAV